MDKDKIILNVSRHVNEIAQAVVDKSIKAESDLLNARLAEPQSYITFVGETSSGKSTLINGMVKRAVLKTAARPTTSTVTQIQCSDIPEAEYYAINQDATLEQIDQGTFNHLTENPDKKLLRLLVELPAPSSSFKGVNIFDTPGFNSIIAEHEEVLKEFIPHSDVIVFAVNYRVGFGMNDQELMGLVGKIFKKDNTLPVILVINRCPAEANISNKRVKEIISNATDSLHHSITLHLVYSVAADENVTEILPSTDEVWKSINNFATSEERLNAVQNKNIGVLHNIIAAIQLECKNRLNAITLDVSNIDDLEKEREEIKIKQNEALLVVDKYIKRLGRVLPELLKKQCIELNGKINAEIMDSGKWTEASPCVAYIAGHALPFGIRRISHNIEDYIIQTFEEMDQELSEMANKTIEHLNSNAQHFKKPEMVDLFKNIALKMGLQFSKTGMNSFVKGIGGVGGSAAGTGNLVKMLVSRGGKLFGKTFSRNVYSQIGKVFTKSFMEKLNVAVTVLVEAGAYVFESNTWQKQLVKKVDEGINSWIDETCKDLGTVMLPTYSESNKKLVSEIYEEFDKEIQREIGYINNKVTIAKEAELNGYLHMLNKYDKELENL